jgi:hypothetical protein
VAISVGSLVAATGNAFASIPDADGMIHACYSKSGNVRVIDNAIEACKGNEAEVQWHAASSQNDARILTESLVVPSLTTGGSKGLTVPGLGVITLACSGNGTASATLVSPTRMNGLLNGAFFSLNQGFPFEFSGTFRTGTIYVTTTSGAWKVDYGADDARALPFGPDMVAPCMVLVTVTAF